MHLAWWREGRCIWLGGGRADAFGLVEGGPMHLAWWREGGCIWLGGGRADAFGGCIWRRMDKKRLKE